MDTPTRRALLSSVLATAVSASPAKKYRVAVIGHTGRGNYGHGIDTVWKAFERMEVVAVSDPDEKGRAAALARTGAQRSYADYRQMLEKEKPDLVGIGPRWMDQRVPMVTAVAEAGAHIYMEKPFCRDLTEADEIVRACEMRHVKLAIAHQTRWSPPVDVVKRELKNGLIGKLLEFRARVGERELQGVDVLTVGDDDLVTELMVMIRPLSALNAVVARMGEVIPEVMAELGLA